MPSQRVLLGSIVVFCAACGGSSASISGKAFLLGQTDNAGTRVVISRGSDVVASARTDSSGAYRIEAPDGAYDLHFEHDGYGSALQPDVVVGKNDVSVPDVTLRRGESIDPAPLLTAQPLGSTKVLVQFDE
ncbi:MAG TPA: carboxypeptidase-like regulatory domain-containing protein, partial [Myxococcales bacterium]|nr:carboxypeptidase-like regulatory domain-containing protein [Myxococcales bacterium]